MNEKLIETSREFYEKYYKKMGEELFQEGYLLLNENKKHRFTQLSENEQEKHKQHLVLRELLIQAQVMIKFSEKTPKNIPLRDIVAEKFSCPDPLDFLSKVLFSDFEKDEFIRCINVIETIRVIFFLSKKKMPPEEIIALDRTIQTARFKQTEIEIYNNLRDQIIMLKADPEKHQALLKNYHTVNFILMMTETGGCNIKLRDLLTLGPNLQERWLKYIGNIRILRDMHDLVGLQEGLKLDDDSLGALSDHMDLVKEIMDEMSFKIPFLVDKTNPNAITAQQFLKVVCNASKQANEINSGDEKWWEKKDKIIQTAVEKIKKIPSYNHEIIKNTKTLSCLHFDQNSFFKKLPMDKIVKISSLMGMNLNVIEHDREAENIAYDQLIIDEKEAEELSGKIFCQPTH